MVSCLLLQLAGAPSIVQEPYHSPCVGEVDRVHAPSIARQVRVRESRKTPFKPLTILNLSGPRLPLQYPRAYGLVGTYLQCGRAYVRAVKSPLDRVGHGGVYQPLVFGSP